jgi:signal transduction histidine kinase
MMSFVLARIKKAAVPASKKRFYFSNHDEFQANEETPLVLPRSDSLEKSPAGEKPKRKKFHTIDQPDNALHYRVLDGLPQAVLMLCRTRIQLVNPAARRMFSGPSGQVPAIFEVWRCLHPTLRARELDRLNALQQGLIEDQSKRLLKLLRLDGSELDAEVTEILMGTDEEGDEGRIVYWLVSDVTLDQQMQRELEDANMQLKQLSQRLIEVQEIERRQIARDLHDDIGQQLTGLKLYLQRLLGKLDSPDAVKTTSDLIEGTDQALTKVRSLSLSLHPLQLETLGLEAALRWHLARFLKVTHTAWELWTEGTLETVPPESSVGAFRIVQEAVNNVAKHAKAANLRVMLNCDEKVLRLEILDDGCGFDVSSAAQGTSSLGLTSMRERVASLGGQLAINSLEGVGTRITVLLPIETDCERSDDITEASCTG